MTQHNTCQNGNESDRMIEDDDDFDDSQDQFHHPQQRNAANARERARMRVLSKAFCRLKTTLPWVPADTKLSKLDTLRLATSYIAHLRAILKLSENDSTDRNIHPVNMSWPFNFNANWDSNSKLNEQSATKTDWNNQKHCSNDINNYGATYDVQSSRRYTINRCPKTRQKNPSYFCQTDSNSVIHSKCDPEYKSYGYYG